MIQRPTGIAGADDDLLRHACSRASLGWRRGIPAQHRRLTVLADNDLSFARYGCCYAVIAVIVHVGDADYAISCMQGQVLQKPKTSRASHCMLVTIQEATATCVVLSQKSVCTL